MPKQIEIPDEFLKAIGMVVVRWNHLELIINLFLIHLMGKEIYENRSHIVFAHMAFPQKLDVLGALAEEAIKTPRYSNLAKYKETVLPLLKQAQVGRNFAIHSIWGIRDGKVMRASISARGSFKFVWVVGTLEEIEKASQSIEDARRELSALASPAWKESIRIHKEGKT